MRNSINQTSWKLFILCAFYDTELQSHTLHCMPFDSCSCSLIHFLVPYVQFWHQWCRRLHKLKINFELINILPMVGAYISHLDRNILYPSETQSCRITLSALSSAVWSKYRPSKHLFPLLTFSGRTEFCFSQSLSLKVLEMVILSVQSLRSSSASLGSRDHRYFINI